MAGPKSVFDVGFDSESKDCAKRVRVRAGPPLSGSMVGR